MPDVWFAIPGDLATLTGGYVYARRLMDALPAAGWRAHHVPLPAGFPNPTAADLAATGKSFSRLQPGTCLLVDGLAFGTLPRTLLENFAVKYVALVHHPLARETGLTDEAVRRLKDSEQQALSRARAIITTSAHTADVLRGEYRVDGSKLFVAPPGTDPAPRAAASNPTPHLLTVATLTQRKGHADLVHALARMTDLSWQSLLVGSLDRDPETVESVRALIHTYGLDDRITLCGELDGPALQAAYAGADAFVLPSRYEGYGMVFAEALARGLPIVACAAGAVTSTVPADAGVLVPPGDVEALAGALRCVVADRPLRKSLGDAAWTHGRRLPAWSDTAAAVSAALHAAVS